MSDYKKMEKNLQQLASRVQNSDPQAYHLLFESLWDGMVLYASTIIGDADIAKDLIQDIWLDYWMRRERVQVSNIKAYLYTAIRKKCYQHLRNNKLSPLQKEVVDSLVLETDDSPEDQLSANLKKLHVSLTKLPERCREIFLLSRINGFSNDEIALHVGVTKKTVENQISTAMKRLRIELKNVNIMLLNLM